MWQHDSKGRTEISGYSPVRRLPQRDRLHLDHDAGHAGGLRSLPRAALQPAVGRASGARDRAGRGRHRGDTAPRRRLDALSPAGHPRRLHAAHEDGRMRARVSASGRSLLRSRRSHAPARLRAHARAHRPRRLARVPPRRARRRDRRRPRGERRLCHARGHRRLRAGARCAARRLVPRLHRALQSAAGQRRDADPDAADPRALRSRQARPQLGAAHRSRRARDGGGARRSQRVSGRPALRRCADRDADLERARRLLGGEDRARRVLRRREAGAALVHHAPLHHGQRRATQ